jgi:DNA ligase-1
MKFARLVDYFARLEETTSRNAMIEILADLFKEAEPEEMDKLVYLCQERLRPAYEGIEFGIGESLAAEALAKATDKSKEEIKRLYKQQGDYGAVAEKLLPAKGKGFTVAQVHGELFRLATTSGEGTVAQKTDILAGLLRGMSSREARYLLRIPLGQLRLGIGDPTVMDGLSWAKAGNKSLRPTIERAYNVCSDLGFVAQMFWKGSVAVLERLSVQPGKPVRMALAERARSAEEIVKRLGECAIEGKFDGFRCQVHKDGDEIHVFSRNLEDNAAMFPDIVEGTRKQVKYKTAIFEGEAVAYDPDSDEFLPFQVTVQRKRKYEIEAMAEKLPLKLLAFDLLYLDGKDYTHQPYTARREALRKAIAPGDVVEIAESLVTGDAAKIDEFFLDKVTHGLEGIMAKRLDAPYQAGARNFNWIKLKRSYQGRLTDTIDCVVLGYWRGRGMRAKFGIGSLLCGVYDKPRDTFLTVAKLGTGFSDEEWVQMRGLLDKIAVREKPARVDSLVEPDVWAEPRYVIEIQADEITRSPVHTCGKQGDEPGYALRFPRVMGFLRQDRQPEDATTVAEVLEMFKAQGKVAVKG